MWLLRTNGLHNEDTEGENDPRAQHQVLEFHHMQPLKYFLYGNATTLTHTAMLTKSCTLPGGRTASVARSTPYCRRLRRCTFHWSGSCHTAGCPTFPPPSPCWHPRSSVSRVRCMHSRKLRRIGCSCSCRSGADPKC